MANRTDMAMVLGRVIKVDRSGVGHCWEAFWDEDFPASIREEIAAEIIDGKRETCDDYLATNGMHYRW